jgi:hypothetical protein
MAFKRYRWVVYDVDNKVVTSRFCSRRNADAAAAQGEAAGGNVRVLGIHDPRVKAYKKSHRYFRLTAEQRRQRERMLA